MKYQLHKTCVEEVVGGLPEVVLFGPESHGDPAKPSLFLCGLGFEDRCLTVPRSLAEIGVHFDACAWFRYSTNLEDNEANRAPLLGFLDKLSPGRPTIVDVDPVRCAQDLRSLLDALNIGSASIPDAEVIPHVTIDISAMSGYLIMVALAVLLERNVHLRILYSEAEIYYPTEQEFCGAKKPRDLHGLHLEEGVSDVFTPKELAGLQIDALPAYVFVFPSFGGGRGRAALGQIDSALATDSNRFYGDSTTWFLGKPHYPENGWRLEATAKMNEIPDHCKVSVISTFDYRHTVQELENEFSSRCANHRITLFFAGSKMQAIGASLFCSMRPEVRAVLSAPKCYKAAHYTRGTRHVWKIDLGPTTVLKSCLSSVDSLVVRRLDS